MYRLVVARVVRFEEGDGSRDRHMPILLAVGPDVAISLEDRQREDLVGIGEEGERADVKLQVVRALGSRAGNRPDAAILSGVARRGPRVEVRQVGINRKSR